MRARVVRCTAMKRQPIARMVGTLALVGCLTSLPAAAQQPMLGLDDQKDAYRGCPVHPDHLCASIVAFRHKVTGAMLFMQLIALMYGLLSAVFEYNADPEFLVA